MDNKSNEEMVKITYHDNPAIVIIMTKDELEKKIDEIPPHLIVQNMDGTIYALPQNITINREEFHNLRRGKDRYMLLFVLLITMMIILLGFAFANSIKK